MKTTHVLMVVGIVVAGIAVMMVPHHHPAAKTATATTHTPHKKPSHAQGNKTLRSHSVDRSSSSPVAKPTPRPHVTVPSVLNQSGTPLWQVKDPQNPTIQWAFSPVAVKETIHDANGFTYVSDVLWFGEKTAHQKTWQWTSIALPGKIPTSLPPPVYDTLLWAYDLHTGQSGPTQNLGSAGNWNTLTGKMSEPQGWQATAYTTPTGVYTVSITPWMASTSLSNVYFGLSTTWTAQNATTGTAAIATIENDPGPLNTITQP